MTLFLIVNWHDEYMDVKYIYKNRALAEKS